MSDGKVINFVYSFAYSYLCFREDTFARFEKYSSKLDIIRSLIRIFAAV